MSRETDFVREITNKTKDGGIHWANVSPGKYTEYIFQSPFAYQAFIATYPKNDKKYQVLLVHKKVPSHNTDFEVVEERHATELIVILDGRLVSSFTNYEVDESDLGALCEAVADNNDDINDLFA